MDTICLTKSRAFWPRQRNRRVSLRGRTELGRQRDAPTHSRSGEGDVMGALNIDGREKAQESQKEAL
jgi:hypothetical protein